MVGKKDRMLAREQEKARRRVIRVLSHVAPLFGPELRRWRLGHALSQAELAKIFGVSRRTVVRWERADRVAQLCSLLLKVLK